MPTVNFDLPMLPDATPFAVPFRSENFLAIYQSDPVHVRAPWISFHYGDLRDIAKLPERELIPLPQLQRLWNSGTRSCINGAIALPCRFIQSFAYSTRNAIMLNMSTRMPYRPNFQTQALLSMIWPYLPPAIRQRIINRYTSIHGETATRQAFFSGRGASPWSIARLCEHCQLPQPIWKFKSYDHYVCSYCALHECHECHCRVAVQGSRYCRNCLANQRAREMPAESKLAINPSHSANPITLLLKRWSPPTNRHFLGVELEYEGSSSALAEKIAREIQNKIPKKFIVKHDGSLAYGGEICTLPLELGAHAEFWHDLFEIPLFAESAICDDSPRTGLHAHISRAPATLPALARYAHFLEAEAFALTQFIAGREPNGYCRYSPWRTWAEELAQIKKPEDRKDKYDVINSKHKATLEVRAYKSTKIYENMMARLQYSYFVMLFAEQHNSRQMTIPNFLAFIARPDNSAASKELRAYLKGYDHSQFTLEKTFFNVIAQQERALGVYFDQWLDLLRTLPKSSEAMADFEHRYSQPQFSRLPPTRLAMLQDAAAHFPLSA